MLGLWAHPGPLCHVVPFTKGSGTASHSLRSWGSPQFLGLWDYWAWIRTLLMALPTHLAPGVGLSTLSQACAWAGKLLAPLPSWVTAPVACVETLRPSHLPVPSVHAGIVSSHCHAASGIAKPTVELSKVYTGRILHLDQDHHPSCPGLGLSALDPSSRPVSHVGALSSSPCSLFWEASSCLVHCHWFRVRPYGPGPRDWAASACGWLGAKAGPGVHVSPGGPDS